MGGTGALSAPFPWYGGKSRWAPEIWENLGDVTVYVEPFFGSGAVLFFSDPHDREIVCDTDGMVCNLFRAIRSDPDAVAYWSDYPTIHQDLTARRHWLRKWRSENAAELSYDPDFCDPKAAGWWTWCVSHWIGPAFKMLGASTDEVETEDSQNGRMGMHDKVPCMYAGHGGRGVSAMRKNLGDQIPHVPLWVGGCKVTAQRVTIDGKVGDGSRLVPWFTLLAERLSRVIILNRDWSAAVTPTKLQHTATGPKPPVGVFLDPPYRMADRIATYDTDDAHGDNPAEDAYEWAVAHGDVYRIAYACKVGDFPIPPGWTCSDSRTFNGHRIENVRSRKKDTIYYSPACQAVEGVLTSSVSDRLL